LYLLLSGWLGHTASNRAWGATEDIRAPVDQGRPDRIPDPRVATLMDRITTDTLVAYERALTGEEPVIISGQLYTLATRNSLSGEPISQATRYVYERFQELGLGVAFHDYTYSGNHWRNVVAERRGLRRPDEIYLITAHLDDMPSGAIAPGADDNASGSSAVLVAADVLRDLDFDCTLRFVLFTGEEQGLLGSAAYAAHTAASGEDVRGVLNLDMIAYNSDADPIVDLHARSDVSGSVAMAGTFSQVVAAYELDLTTDVHVDHWLGNFSDNRSFWDQGYAAILVIEDEDDFTPYYHMIDDTMGTLDIDYFTEIVRAGIGTFAHKGCLVSTGLLIGTVTARELAVPLSATVTARTFTHAFTTTTGVDGDFSLKLPVDTYTLHVAASLRDYQPAVVTNVIVFTNQTTVQHLTLDPWLFHLFVPVQIQQTRTQH